MKVVIVGGGTAGWLAALMISKTQPAHEIVLIESSKIGIVGAGEGSTGLLTDIIQGRSWDFGCNEYDFFRETGATIKLGIKHKEWKSLGHEYIAPIDSPRQIFQYGTSTKLMHTILNDIPFYTSSRNGFFISKNQSSFYLTKEGIVNNSDHSYHFDAHKVSKYFKKVCGDKILTIDSVVLDIIVKENGYVTDVIIEDGSTIPGDFFIDASGFNRLFANKLQNKWISYSDYLPVNTAMPFLIDHEEGKEIAPLTVAWAQKAGWMWMIPTQDRYGCGYVFDNRYISNEEAQKEIQDLLGKDIDPIRFLNFDTGRLTKFWDNNVLSIGLTSAFAEPLEATSIHSTIVQLSSWVFNYLRDSVEETVNYGSINTYNNSISTMYDSFKDFLSLHYSSKRSDSEFWKDISKIEKRTTFSKNIILSTKTRAINDADIPSYFGYAGSGLYNWILSGLGYIDKDLAKKELVFYNQEGSAKNEYENHMSAMNLKGQSIENTKFINMIREGII